MVQLYGPIFQTSVAFGPLQLSFDQLGYLCVWSAAEPVSECLVFDPALAGELANAAMPLSKHDFYVLSREGLNEHV